MNSELLNIAVEAAENKKAEDIISLNMNEISDMTDYFVVCHGNNERQVQSIARSVKVAHKHDIDVKRMEGYQARWILIDLACCSCFHKDEKKLLQFRELYQDAPIKEYGQAVFSHESI